MVTVFKNVGERSTAKNYRLLVSKVFNKLVNNRIVDHVEKCGLFFIFSMVLGLLDQLQIFWQLVIDDGGSGWEFLTSSSRFHS